jgi:L-ascorbate oxidase
MKFRRTGRFAPAVIAIGLILTSAEWQSEVQSQVDRVVTNPPRLNDVGRTASPLLLGRGVVPTSLSEQTLDLNVAYTVGQVWNPSTDRYDRVNLRSYQGTQVDPQAPFVSPTIEVNPGDTLRMTLHNRLPADAGCTSHPDNPNTPHCFNGTNLHTHGLWINPNGNGDNVLISINPGVSFQYEYNIPPDHPAGTFWYHTHRHGSTAIQVSSGMAGALIVRGNRLPGIRGGGDIDTLLRPTPTQPFTERIVVMQQMQYSCRDATGAVKVNDAGNYRCDPGDIGSVESYAELGPSGWVTSGRYTSINGHVLPTFAGARAGQLERWRMIHAGIRDTINLQLRAVTGTTNVSGLPASGNDRFIDANCGGAPLPQHLIAADGLTLGAIQKTDQTVFQPGYRWDALMLFPKPGIYCVIDAAGQVPGVGQPTPSRQLLGFVIVQPGYDVSENNSTPFVLDALTDAAYRNLPDQVRRTVIADLNAGLKLTSFIPHEDIAPNEVTGTRTLTFDIVRPPAPEPALFHVDGRAFDPARLDRVLTLGAVDEWNLKSVFVGHPFHIHVNPFQIVRILDPTGKDVSGPDALDTFGSATGAPDPQFRGMKGVWKDTLWLKNTISPAATVQEQAAGAYTAIVRTRYRRYIGDFVLHCHILDHEDQGMMQNVRIALPGAEGTHPH